MPDANVGTETGNTGTTGAETNGETPEDFAAWLSTQPEDRQQQYKTSISGLTSALEAERTRANTQVKEMRKLAAAAEAGSEAQKALTEMADANAETAKQSAFFVAAHSAGVNDLELAYIAATKANLVRNDGSVDIAALQAKHPALFNKVIIPNGNAGSGAGAAAPSASYDVNTNLRRAAGYQV